jgi:hypothetical protein
MLRHNFIVPQRSKGNNDRRIPFGKELLDFSVAQPSVSPASQVKIDLHFVTMPPTAAPVMGEMTH